MGFEAIIYWFFVILAPLGVFLVCGYGLLKMGRAINLGLQKGRDRRWMMAVVGIAGLVVLLAELLFPVYHEWTRALGALLLVPALVTFINYRGK